MLCRRILLLAFACLLFNRSLTAQTSNVWNGPLATRPVDRIVSPIDENNRIVLSANRHPLARTDYDLGTAPPDHRMERLILTLRADSAQQGALDSLIEAQHDPNSAYYHQWLTPEAYATHFGVSTNDLSQIVNWLLGHGFEVEEIDSGRRSILFSGTAAQVKAAFHAEIHTYLVGSELHYANANDPEIPASMREVVDGIAALHDFRSRSMQTSLQTPSPNGTAHYLTPADFAVVYDLAPLYRSGIDGSGQSLAIAGRTNVSISDVRLFRSTYGLLANDPEIIVNGADPGVVSQQEEAEATLAIEWSGAVAKNAAVYYVASASTSGSDGVLLSARYIVQRNLAAVMLVTFGLCEAALGTTGNSFVGGLWQQAATQGMTVVVASGDSGAAGCDDPSVATAAEGRAVNGFASTPYNTSVGGTEFNDNAGLYWSSTHSSGAQATALHYIPENVWNESGASGLWSSGGGSSTIYKKPFWQDGLGVPADGMRDVPDVALSAAGHDGYLVSVNGGFQVAGGTSAAASAFAGIAALMVQSVGTRQGNASPALYALATLQELAGGAAIFHDIRIGSNSVPGVTGYQANLGYDLATGLGSVDATLLANHWSDASGPVPAFHINLPTTSVSLYQGSNASLEVSVAVGGGYSASVALKASGLPPLLSATFAPASFAAPGSGTSKLKLIAGANVVPGTYTVSVAANSRGIEEATTLAVTVLPPPDYAITAEPGMISLLKGQQGTVTLTTTANIGLNVAVALSLSGLPTGVTAAFAPAAIAAPGSGASTLTLSAGSTAEPGTYLLTVKATAAEIIRTSSFTLLIPNNAATTLKPVLFYTDIDSGPATGGEGGTDGAFLCAYGENFGMARGTSSITVGGAAMATYQLWTDPGAPYLPGRYAKACGQISHATANGPQNVGLTTANGTSNALSFTVRTGHIYFAATSGSDKNPGTSSKPFQTLKACKNALAPGDICYIHGMTVTTADNYKTVLWLGSSGACNSAAASELPPNPCKAEHLLPKAVVGYPGETVVLDGSASADTGYALWNYMPGGYGNYWTIANLSFNAYTTAVYFRAGKNMRFVGNDVSCTGPNCLYAAAGFIGSGVVSGSATQQSLDTITIFGNRFHDIGCSDYNDSARYTQYANSPHPCLWETSGASRAYSDTTGTILHLVSPSNWSAPMVVQLVNPVSGKTDMVRPVKSPSQKYCTELANYTFDCAAKSGTSWQLTLDHPLSAPIPQAQAVAYKFRFYAPHKMEHNVYFGAATYRLDFAWNEIDGGAGQAFRGFQIFHDAIPNNHDLIIHDNYIHDTVSDGINLAAFDPSCGPVEIYNNLIVNAGKGVSDIIADPPGGGGNNAGIYVPGGYPWYAAGGTMCSKADGVTPAYPYQMQIYNNTIVNSGIVGSMATMQWPTGKANVILPFNSYTLTHPHPQLVLTNNILVQTAKGSSPYFYGDSRTMAGMNANGNLCYGAGACPSFFTASASGDPLFIQGPSITAGLPTRNSGSLNLRIQSGSRAILAGTASPTALTDLDGRTRVSPAAAGAYTLNPATSQP